MRAGVRRGAAGAPLAAEGALRAAPEALAGPAGGAGLLECVANASEGREPDVISLLSAACEPCLLDVHADADHNRSVFTFAGKAPEVMAAARRLARLSVDLLDLRRHSGVHPRFGVLDVVPWVGLEGWPLRDARPGSPASLAASAARRSFATWVADELAVPVFLYGPERSLPEVRREAWRRLAPDFGPPAPHPTAGSVAVGVRPVLVAYNLWMGRQVGRDEAREIAAGLRSPDVRALAFPVTGCYQVSCNLLRPLVRGPAQVFDEVSALAPVTRAELVGLVPAAVLEGIPAPRWGELGLAPSQTIEARLAGHDSYQ